MIATNNAGKINSPLELINQLKPNNPILCISKQELEKSVNNFLKYFPGKVLYAVKTNPHPIIIENLVKLGISNFDVASIEEMSLVKKISSNAKCYFNHPIKSREAIKQAYYNFNIRDFVVDHIREFQKLSDEIDIKQVITQFRINIPSGSKIYDFSTKFGMTLIEFEEFFKIIPELKLHWALSFHVGSQCEDPNAYQQALNTCLDIINKLSSNHKPEYINVGGGFPGYYNDRRVPPLIEYFHIIQKMQKRFDLPFLCEPGRAILWNAGSLIVQIITRKDNRLYINDGVYGALNELDYAKLTPNIIAVSHKRKLNDTKQKFTIFGPTCDSFDVLENPFTLPDNIDEEDWLIIPENGAYSNALTTNFNGFVSNTLQLID